MKTKVFLTSKSIQFTGALSFYQGSGSLLIKKKKIILTLTSGDADNNNIQEVL